MRCPWGEAGSTPLEAALGFSEAVDWLEAIRQLARKADWAEEGRLRVEVLELTPELELDSMLRPDSGLLVLVNVPETEAAEVVAASSGHGTWSTFVLSAPSSGCSVVSQLQPRAGGPPPKLAADTAARCAELWARGTAEDALYAVLFAVHFAVAPVELVGREPAIDTPWKVCTLLTRCWREALGVALDPAARACLACQTACDPRDQTQMYRCTVSYESAALAKLVRAFEKRKIFDCGAKVPALPDFAPLSRFRGEPLTGEAAWRILEGHWNSSQGCSWRPVLGQNPAYDFFPCQFNSWYRDPRGDSGWYDPTFKVVTLDGSEVWRRRHYRVRPDKTPGSFWLSTEDNGISLKEHWRIVDADDDLAWAVFHYAGAAPAVGQSYSGSLLLTQDGLPPPSCPKRRIVEAFGRSGVAPFELYSIAQDDERHGCRSGACGAPPLTDFTALKRYASAM